MPIVVRGPKCLTIYQLKDELAGRKAKCKKCGDMLEIPAVNAPVGKHAASDSTKHRSVDGRTSTQSTTQAVGTAARPPHARTTTSPKQDDF